MSKLILMRHGQSRWNEMNLFTGWVDIPLSEKGVQEAVAGGQEISEFPIDVIFTSTLIRAQETLTTALRQHSSGKTPLFLHPDNKKINDWSVIHSDEAFASCIPVYQSWHLNERMYGDLQGLNKQETAAKYGKEQVHIWRRSYNVPPPNGESLAICAQRTIPYFEEHILPRLASGENILIVAHGNSLRSIIMDLEKLDENQVLQLELPTGKPMIFEFSNSHFERVK